MNPYKSEEKNETLRRIVKDFTERWEANSKLWGMSYLSKDEFILDITHMYSISYGMAAKVTWIVRSDGARDQKALEVFGFNKHTA